MTTSEAISLAMSVISLAKKQAVEEKEKYVKDRLIPFLKELETETGLPCPLLNNPKGIILDEDGPDNKFNEALEVLSNAFNEFEDFENEYGEEEIWQLTSAESVED